jgi:hypothetical protein
MQQLFRNFDDWSQSVLRSEERVARFEPKLQYKVWELLILSASTTYAANAPPCARSTTATAR